MKMTSTAWTSITTLALFVTAFTLSQTTRAEQYGIGAMIGDPTAITGKLFIDEVNSIDVGVGWSFAPYTGTHIHADYLWERVHKVGKTDAYFGVGGKIVSINSGDDKDKFGLAARAPAGLTFVLPDPRVEFFGEAALVLGVTPKMNLDLDAAVGARFLFD